MPSFRPNVAALIINKKGKLLICERISDTDAWQFPQGGVDKGESEIEALTREVYEEVGLTKSDYKIKENNGPYYYFYPGHIRGKKKYDGQKQTYFLLKLKKKAGEVNLNVLSQPEFSAYRWVKPENFNFNWLPSFKREVYREVLRDFFSVELELQNKVAQ